MQVFVEEDAVVVTSYLHDNNVSITVTDKSGSVQTTFFSTENPTNNILLLHQLRHSVDKLIGKICSKPLNTLNKKVHSNV